LDLGVALSAIQQEFSTQAGVDFRVSVVGQQQPLGSAIQDEIYRIGKQALVNAFVIPERSASNSNLNTPALT